MRRFLGWALKLLGLYLLFLVAYFLFALASMSHDVLAVYERRINPSTFLFWQNGELFTNPPLFSSFMADPKGQLTSREPEALGDVDIWVLLLEGFEDIKTVEFAPQLGIDIERVATSQPGSSTSLRGVSIKLRMHPIPLYVSRKHILIMDALHLRESYKTECLDEMVYGSMVGQRDQDLWDRCKKN